MHEAIQISDADASQLGQARRRAASIARTMGLDEVRAGELSIIVTEAARNIAVHAGEGQLILAPWTVQREQSEGTSPKAEATWDADEARKQISGIDVFALDRGPGIIDLERAGEDGYSTAGTSGQGLGAIRRLATTVGMFSLPGAGTALFARVLTDRGTRNGATPGVYGLGSQPEKLLFGSLAIPITGEQHCGDSWSSHYYPDRSIHMIADGLGHGPMASEASAEAVRVFEECADLPPEPILRHIHAALGKTRGAAVSIAEIIPSQKIVNYSGAGNVTAAVHTAGKSRNMVSMNGTVGHSVAKFNQFSYPWENGSLLLMYSDGLGTRTNVEQYSGLSSCHPALIAAVLYRDFSRGRDDASVLVTRP